MRTVLPWDAAWPRQHRGSDRKIDLQKEQLDGAWVPKAYVWVRTRMRSLRASGWGCNGQSATTSRHQRSCAPRSLQPRPRAARRVKTGRGVVTSQAASRGAPGRGGSSGGCRVTGGGAASWASWARRAAMGARTACGPACSGGEAGRRALGVGQGSGTALCVC